MDDFTNTILDGSNKMTMAVSMTLKEGHLTERKGSERKETERKETERKETERKETEKKEMERKESERKVTNREKASSFAEVLKGKDSREEGMVVGNKEDINRRRKVMKKGRSMEGMNGWPTAGAWSQVMKLTTSMDVERRETERKDTERKEMERKEKERKETKRKETERKEIERKESERMEMKRKEMERKETERKETERKEKERKEMERREIERKESERLESERKELERKETERKEMERREMEGKKTEGKETEKEETERMVTKREETERKEAEETERKEMERKEILERMERDGRISRSAGIGDSHSFEMCSLKLATQLLEAREEIARLEGVIKRMSLERIEMERKETEKKKLERKETEGKETERREMERENTHLRDVIRRLERKETERKESEKKEIERKETERKELERKENEGKEMERKESERKETERKETEKMELGRKETIRMEIERKELERKETEREETKRKDTERKETERKEMGRKERERKETERKKKERKEIERLKEEIERLKCGSLSSPLCKGSTSMTDAAASIAQSTMLGPVVSEGSNPPPSSMGDDSSLPPLPQRATRNFITRRGGVRIPPVMRTPPPMVNRGVETGMEAFQSETQDGAMFGLESIEAEWRVVARRSRRRGSGVEDGLSSPPLPPRPLRKRELIVAGFYETAETAEIMEALCYAGGCPEEDIRMGPIRTRNNGLSTVWVQLPVAAALMAAEKGRILIGRTAARVELLKARPLQCFKCWAFGHRQDVCRSVANRLGACYKCGQTGHFARECENLAHCAVCFDVGKKAHHRMGGPLCAAQERHRELSLERKEFGKEGVRKGRSYPRILERNEFERKEFGKEGRSFRKEGGWKGRSLERKEFGKEGIFRKEGVWKGRTLERKEFLKGRSLERKESKEFG